MKRFNILLSDSAVKELSVLENWTKQRIKSSLKELSKNPFRKRAGADIKKLKGLKNPDLYRLRVGNYRIIYAIDKNFVKITHIIKRSKVYEMLD